MIHSFIHGFMDSVANTNHRRIENRLCSSMPSFMASPMPFASPGREAYSENAPANDKSSVRLSCLSPDGRSVHSLSIVRGQGLIETRTLPLDGTVEDNDASPSGPSLIRAILPEQISQALRRYPAIALLCVDVESNATSTVHQSLPKLCLYTQRDVFVLEIGYQVTPGVSQTDRTVVKVTEPFEGVLLGSSPGTRVVCIRQAPQRHNGFAIMCPPKSMAMMIFDPESSETSVVLYHGTNDTTTTALVYGQELYDKKDHFTNFCFGQSSALSLLSNTSIMMLKGSGDVYIAGPALFRGSVVPRALLDTSLEYLRNEIQQTEPNTPKWRQTRLALQNLADAFPVGVKAQFLTAEAQSPIFEVPAQLQGPALIGEESDELESMATCIESFAAGNLVGFAIGHTEGIVEFGVLVPSTLVPRFASESHKDMQVLDDEFIGGMVITRIDLRDEEGDFDPTSSMNLVKDPLIDSVLHCVTGTQIISVSTNTLKIIAKELSDQVGTGMMSPILKPKTAQPNTTAWPCLDVTSTEGNINRVVGAVVSGDVQFGHVLIARLSNNSMVAVNLTEARLLKEMEIFDKKEAGSASDARVAELSNIAPLHQIIEPLAKQVVEGLGGLTKVVGSATPIAAATPDQLAAAVAIKQSCDEKIYLPLIEITEHLKSRKEILSVMYKNQMLQLDAVQNMISKLKEREAIIKEMTDVAKANSTSLSQRSAAILQSSNDLMPKLSQAEYDYFQELRKLEEKTRQWTAEFEGVHSRVDSLQQTVYDDTMQTLDALPQQRTELSQLQGKCTTLLAIFEDKLDDAEMKLDDIADAAGMERDSEM
ncbi:unnamed protein product [Cylindrotheca closterium]|uniref:Uncharacterized protein n=1 Tax=Cylindrotheca closterium TaxID=2856 RepID=A0AAD2FXM2_9STRA|nr:unnamed protein product [Cylindrotheca closterium]